MSPENLTRIPECTLHLFCRLMVEVMTAHPLADGTVLRGANMPRLIDVWFGGAIMRFDQQMALTVSGNAPRRNKWPIQKGVSVK